MHGVVNVKLSKRICYLQLVLFILFVVFDITIGYHSLFSKEMIIDGIILISLYLPGKLLQKCQTQSMLLMVQCYYLYFYLFHYTGRLYASTAFTVQIKIEKLLFVLCLGE